MNSQIIFVSGSKGGVGKSILTMATLDYMTSANRLVKLVETDLANPDVWKSYGRGMDSELLDLDDEDGWISLVNMLDADPHCTFVVNTPARSNESVRNFGSILTDSLAELNRRLVTLWVINRQRDSIELLDSYMNLMPSALLHVVRNGYFGDERKFELYDQSGLKPLVKNQGGLNVYLPDLADRVTDALYTDRITIAEAAAQLKLGDRAVLQSWRTAVKKIMTQLEF